MNWLDMKPTPQQKRNRYLKQVADRIRSGGMSSHSAQGSSLQQIINLLEETGDSYQLTAHPKCGYMLQGIPNIIVNELEN